MTDISYFRGETTVEVAATPPGWLSGAKGITKFKMDMCADCGFTEFYAASPLVVWDEWRKRRE